MSNSAALSFRAKARFRAPKSRNLAWIIGEGHDRDELRVNLRDLSTPSLRSVGRDDKVKMVGRDDKVKMVARNDKNRGNK